MNPVEYYVEGVNFVQLPNINNSPGSYLMEDKNINYLGAVFQLKYLKELVKAISKPATELDKVIKKLDPMSNRPIVRIDVDADNTIVGIKYQCFYLRVTSVRTLYDFLVERGIIKKA